MMMEKLETAKRKQRATDESRKTVKRIGGKIVVDGEARSGKVMGGKN